MSLLKLSIPLPVRDKKQRALSNTRVVCHREALQDTEFATVCKHLGCVRSWKIRGRSKKVGSRRRRKFLSLFETQQNPHSCSIHLYSEHGIDESDKLLFHNVVSTKTCGNLLASVRQFNRFYVLRNLFINTILWTLSLIVSQLFQNICARSPTSRTVFILYMRIIAERKRSNIFYIKLLCLKISQSTINTFVINNSVDTYLLGYCTELLFERETRTKKTRNFDKICTEYIYKIIIRYNNNSGVKF